MAKSHRGFAPRPEAPAAGPLNPDFYPPGRGPGDLGSNMFGQGGQGALPPRGFPWPEGAACDGGDDDRDEERARRGISRSIPRGNGSSGRY